MKNDTPFRQKSKTFIDILKKTDKKQKSPERCPSYKQFKIFRL